MTFITPNKHTSQNCHIYVQYEDLAMVSGEGGGVSRSPLKKYTSNFLNYIIKLPNMPPPPKKNVLNPRINPSLHCKLDDVFFLKIKKTLQSHLFFIKKDLNFNIFNHLMIYLKRYIIWCLQSFINL